MVRWMPVAGPATHLSLGSDHEAIVDASVGCRSVKRKGQRRCDCDASSVDVERREPNKRNLAGQRILVCQSIILNQALLPRLTRHLEGTLQESQAADRVIYYLWAIRHVA